MDKGKSFVRTVENSNWADPVRKTLINKGVRKIPRSPEALALKMATEIFPFAIDTMTTEELTVEGRAERKNSESHNSDRTPSSKSGMNINVRSGKTTKVHIWIRRCTR